MRAAALALVLAAAALAQPAVPPLTGRVVDLADVLTPATESALTGLLAAHEDSTGNQIAVLTVPSLDGAVLERYALDVARAWGLGQADRDNGVLLLVAVEDRELRIEVGSGLEGALPDATAASIIRNEIVPEFRAGDFDQGVTSGTVAIVGAIEGEYVAEAGGSEEMGWLERLVVGLVMVVFPVTALVTPVVVAGGTGLKGDAGAGCLGLFAALFLGFGLALLTGLPEVLIGAALVLPLVLIGLNRWLEQHPAWGPKRRHQRAKQAAFKKARKRGARSVVVDGTTYTVPTGSSSSGGGGFSGGGGGFSGGGASGSW